MTRTFEDELRLFNLQNSKIKSNTGKDPSKKIVMIQINFQPSRLGGGL